MEQKKYMDVVRLGHKTTAGMLNVGDNIVIQEKIDGSNASFKLEDGKIVAFSRKTQLDEHNNTLRGFWNWTQTLDPSMLVDRAIYFGEWLCPHKVKYPQDKINQFYLFDVYDTSIEKYVRFSLVQYEAKRLGLNLIPTFYVGKYISFEHLMSFVGKTHMGATVDGEECGEGVVVKNVDYIDTYGNQLFVKLVVDKFREIQKQKAPKNPNVEDATIIELVTEARVYKELHKMVDEGILKEDFAIEDMPTILKHLGSRIYADIVKEEKDMLPENYEEEAFRKNINKHSTKLVRKILMPKDEVLFKMEYESVFVGEEPTNEDEVSE